jgi:hypothetical protein
MVIRGTARVTCPGCGKAQDCELVQSTNTRTNPADKQRLLAGELDVLACECGKRTQLVARLVFHDPDADYYCQVVPGDEAAMRDAAAAFAASGATGTGRIVPSLNALVEKLKLLDAGLADWAIEMTKVLLLASIGELERVLLFDTLDREAGIIHWLLFDAHRRNASRMSSPFAAYEKLAARPQSKPAANELRIDRAWAVEAVKSMIAAAN